MEQNGREKGKEKGKKKKPNQIEPAKKKVIYYSKKSLFQQSLGQFSVVTAKRKRVNGRTQSVKGLRGIKNDSGAGTRFINNSYLER